MRALAFTLLTAFILVSSSLIVQASNLTVSLSVGLTYFIINGYTSPSAVITLKENGAVIATAAADSSGYYEVSTQGEDGVHTYGVYGVDPEGRTTPTISHTVSLTPGSSTTIGDLILPPTLIPDTVDTSVGTDITLRGYAAPLSDVMIFFASELMATVRTDTTGLYTGRIDTGQYGKGTHILTTRNSLGNGNSSLDSHSFTITLRDPEASTVPVRDAGSETSSDPSVTASSAPERGIAWWILHFDVDGDNRLELSEIENIANHWVASWAELKDGHCDIDGDRECKLNDFSILMYYIERSL